MTDDPELESRLHTHYRSLDPGPAPAGFEHSVERALDRRARGGARRRWVVPAAAAAVVVALAALGGLGLAGLLGTRTAPSAPSAAASPVASAPAPSSPAPQASPTAAASAASSPSPAASLATGTALDRVGSFPGGLWAVRGSSLLVSTDAGATWSVGTMPGLGTPPGQDPWLPVVAMTDALHAVVLTAAPGATAGNGGSASDVLHLVASRTSDGGRTWASASVPGNWPGTIVSLAFADEQHGFIEAMPDRLYAGIVDGAVIATSDGGRTWSITGRESSWGRTLSNPWIGTEFAASDSTTIWAAAEPEAGPLPHPVLVVSHDAGRTWREVTLPGLAAAVGGTVYGGTQVWAAPPLFTSSTDGWLTAFGSDPSANQLMLLYRTTDGGQRWWQAAKQTGQPSGGIAVLDAAHWLVPVDNLPYSGILATADGGASWSPLPGAGAPTNPWLVWIAALDARHVAAATPAGNSYPAQVALLLSSDAGRSWTPATLPSP